MRAANISRVPKVARGNKLQASARPPNIRKMGDIVIYMQESESTRHGGWL